MGLIVLMATVAVRATFGRPKMAFYELRHFAATYLLELGGSAQQTWPYSSATPTAERSS